MSLRNLIQQSTVCPDLELQAFPPYIPLIWSSKSMSAHRRHKHYREMLNGILPFQRPAFANACM